jgi:hypothetical protein
MRTVRVTSAKMSAAFVSSGTGDHDGIVVAAHPAVRFLLGFPDRKARGVIKRNGWQAKVTTDAAVTVTCTDKLPPAEPFGDRLCHCGKVGPFGVGVFLLQGKEGTWFCREHAPMFRVKAA